MTLLAQQGRTLFQQGEMITAMRVVAQAAVFGNRRVFPQEGATFFSVAVKTGVVDRRTGQQSVVVTIMGVMAVRAGHFPEPERMAAAPVGFRAGPLMAGKTHILLCQLVHHRITLLMHLVATRAGHLLFFVHAACPGQGDAVIVTGRADFIHRIHRGFGIECYRGRQACAVVLFFTVGCAWTMTGLTIVAALCEWRVFCATDPHRGQEYFVRLQVPALPVTAHALPGAIRIFTHGFDVFISGRWVGESYQTQKDDKNYVTTPGTRFSAHDTIHSLLQSVSERKVALSISYFLRPVRSTGGPFGFAVWALNPAFREAY